MPKTRSAEILRRYVCLTAGLTIMAFGIAFSIKARLGTSPISSLPYVVSLFTPLTVGNVSIIMHVTFVVIQVLILRRRYQLIQLLQLPIAVAFGYLTDFAVWATGGIAPVTYWQQWLVCLAGIALVGFGISLEVTANVVTLGGEGTILAICQVVPVKFGTMKVLFDVTLVASAAALSFIFMHGLQGVREGTVAAAILVGLIARRLCRAFAPLHDRYLCRSGG